MSVNSSHPYAAIARSLEVVLLARHALRLALADNLLAEPLGCEALLQQLEVLNDVPAALDDGVLGCDGAVGRDAELEGRKERMRDLVCGEDNVVVLEEALRQQVAERVVFLVEGEDGRVRDAYCGLGSVIAHGGGLRGAYGSPPCVRPWTGRRRGGRARTCLQAHQLCATHGGCSFGRRAVHSSARARRVCQSCDSKRAPWRRRARSCSRNRSLRCAVVVVVALESSRSRAVYWQRNIL
jgi:hypothetical protein